jgi:hypothetical protein
MMHNTKQAWYPYDEETIPGAAPSDD